jgi:hypothetical protein
MIPIIFGAVMVVGILGYLLIAFGSTRGLLIGRGQQWRQLGAAVARD